MERLEVRLDELQEVLGETTRAVQGLRNEVHRRTVWQTVALAIMALALVTGLIVFASIQLNNDRRIKESEARWCPVLSLLTSSPEDEAPTTERGKQIAREATLLAASFGCRPN